MEALSNYDNIILYGAGGGFDIYGGLPLYWQLKDAGKNVLLANFSFTDDLHTYVDTTMVKITENLATTKKNTDYFPELWLSRFIKQPVYAVRLHSPEQIIASFAELISQLQGTTILVLVDAGHDIVLFGDEIQRGTPFEDTTSVVVAKQLSDELKIGVMIACISAPTELMDFEKFIYQYPEIQGPYLPKMADVKYIERLEELLDTTDKNYRSIPSEALLAGLKLAKGQLELKVQTELTWRLCQRAIANDWTPDDFPLASIQAAIYYFIDFNLLINKSQYYQRVLEHYEKTRSISWSMGFE